MNTPPSRDPVLTEHTFGRDHFSPPPMALEQAGQDHEAAGGGIGGHGVGEVAGRGACDGFKAELACLRERH